MMGQGLVAQMFCVIREHGPWLDGSNVLGYR